MNAHMFKEGDKSFLKFPAISREQSTGDRINAKRSVKCVHPVTFLARKIVDEASSQLRGNKVAREKGTGLRYRLIYNLQFLFFRCLHFTRRSSSPSPSLSLSLSLQSFHNSVSSRGIVSPLFSIMKANYATENQETRACSKVRTIQMPFL